MIDQTLMRQLHALLGRHVEYSGHTCQIIEILDSERSLVIRCEGKDRVIQGNQFGEATRRVQETHTLPLFDEGEHLNPVISNWLD